MMLFVYLWAAWVTLCVVVASVRWLHGVADWHLHGKHCIYCRSNGRFSPFQPNSRQPA